MKKTILPHLRQQYVTYVTSRERKLTIKLGLSGFKIDGRECD